MTEGLPVHGGLMEVYGGNLGDTESLQHFTEGHPAARNVNGS